MSSALADNADFIDAKATLLASFLTFTRYFFPLLTGREFVMTNPIDRECHFITIAKFFTKAYRTLDFRGYLGIAPGYSKSTMCCFWVAWTMARHPDSKYLYISHSKKLSTKHTGTIRDIICLKEYGELFGVYLKNDSRGREFFTTTDGGEVAAFGLQGGATGRDGGMPMLDRFSGAIIVDDAHTADDVTSDAMRENAIDIFKGTVLPRKRGINVPIIMIAQRLREMDLPDWVLGTPENGYVGGDGYVWDRLMLQSLDANDNALYPEKDTKEALIRMREYDPYNFWAQHQQNPQPPGGSLFKRDYFETLEIEPDYLCTFITADTAETEKNYNDASAFSFWGLYKIKAGDIDTGMYALHWINCWEIRVEPAELEGKFIDFWARCLMHKVKPAFAIIEEESTGVTLVSSLRKMPGLQVRGIKRKRNKNGDPITKSSRFIAMQHHVNRRQITLPFGDAHTENCITHMSKITANDSHAFDDICDTAYDAVKVALIDETLIRMYDKIGRTDNSSLANAIISKSKSIERSYYGQR